MKWSQFHSINVCGSWYVHNRKLPGNVFRTNNTTNKSCNNDNITHNTHIRQNNINNNPQTQYVALPSVSQSNNTSLNIKYGSVHNTNSYCNNYPSICYLNRTESRNEGKVQPQSVLLFCREFLRIECKSVSPISLLDLSKLCSQHFNGLCILIVTATSVH